MRRTRLSNAENTPVNEKIAVPTRKESTFIGFSKVSENTYRVAEYNKNGPGALIREIYQGTAEQVVARTNEMYCLLVKIAF